MQVVSKLILDVNIALGQVDTSIFLIIKNKYLKFSMTKIHREKLNANYSVSLNLDKAWSITGLTRVFTIHELTATIIMYEAIMFRVSDVLTA